MIVIIINNNNNNNNNKFKLFIPMITQNFIISV